MEPISHYFYSHRLRLHFWDWGREGKPSLVLVHGGLDHGRSWDWVARALRDDYHVYALDLRGHGNSEWGHGAIYSPAEHILDLSALVDIIDDFPIYLVGHSLGGVVVLHYAGIYPDRARKVVGVEGLGPPLNSKMFRPADERMRDWIEGIRGLERRDPRTYTNLEAAVLRMKEANKHLSDEQARRLTLHGTNWNADGSLIWKFDNYARLFAPYAQNIEDSKQILSQITCPVLSFWGMESWAQDPELDSRSHAISNHRWVKVPNAGHWLHHDQLEIFLAETKKFLAE